MCRFSSMVFAALTLFFAAPASAAQASFVPPRASAGPVEVAAEVAVELTAEEMESFVVAEQPVPVDSEPSEVTLEDLRKTPSAYIGKPVAFALQLAEYDQPWTPFPTRFGPHDFARVSGWSEEQLPWDAAAYRDPAPYLFCRRGEVADWALARGRRHERWWLTGRVVQVFGGEPWIEVESAQRLGVSITEGAVLHTVRARDLERRGQINLACSEIERALASPMPAHASADLELYWEQLERRKRRVIASTLVPTDKRVYRLNLDSTEYPRGRR